MSEYNRPLGDYYIGNAGTIQPLSDDDVRAELNRKKQ